MDLIKEVKQRADIVKVAEYYGLQLNRSNKCKCPFHQEKTASFSVSQSKQIFKCFGCGVGGDCITLVSKLLKINNYQAAESINKNLGLGLNPNQKSTFIEINYYKNKRQMEEQFKKWENETFQILCDYIHFLEDFEEKYAPQNIKELDNPNELYLEAINNKELTESYLDDIFINGTNENKIWFQRRERRWLENVKSRVRTWRTTNK